jgi:hypothetical protein
VRSQRPVLHAEEAAGIRLHPHPSCFSQPIFDIAKTLSNGLAAVSTTAPPGVRIRRYSVQRAERSIAPSQSFWVKPLCGKSDNTRSTDPAWMVFIASKQSALYSPRLRPELVSPARFVKPVLAATSRDAAIPIADSRCRWNSGSWATHARTPDKRIGPARLYGSSGNGTQAANVQLVQARLPRPAQRSSTVNYRG